MPGKRRGWGLRAAALFGLGVGATASCGGGGGATGMCGASVPAGQACNSLTDMGTPVMPTCASGTMPVGTGGTIADGTYVLTAETYYNTNFCPTAFAQTETLQIAGDCMQVVSSPFASTGSVRLTVAGATLTTTRTCVHSSADGGTSMAGPSTQTFTATATTFTLFTDFTSATEPGTDNVAVFTKL